VAFFLRDCTARLTVLKLILIVFSQARACNPQLKLG
jgi:hypothetical protein